MVVDDGSGDGTAEAARAAGADQVLVQPANRGKGAAVRAGMLAANGRTVAFTDADLAYAPAQLVPLLAGVEDGWDVVVGQPAPHRDDDARAGPAAARGRRPADQPGSPTPCCSGTTATRSAA